MKKEENCLLKSNKEFLNEVLESNICPDNFEKIYNEFQEYQKLTLKALFAFHNICEKNKIPYIVAYGSLLGLIRNNGQIPWDYDVDVLVPIEKREQLVKCLNKDLTKEFYINDMSNNKKCPHVSIRLAPVGYTTDALHVDIFFLTGAPSDEEKRMKMAKKLRIVSLIRVYKYNNIKFAGYKNPKAKFKMILKRILLLPIPIKPILKKYYSLCKNPSMNSEYSIRADAASRLFVYKSKDVWNTTLMKIDSKHELRIPVKYEKILTDQYGDYSKIPPLNQRIQEVLNSYNRLIRSKIDDNEKSSK